MNREIKFRVFDRTYKEIHVVGSDYHDSIDADSENRIYYYNLQNGEGSITGEELPEDESGYILMQYTGLKDKNGKEVYEGDILESSLGWRYVVEWDEDNGRFIGFTIENERKICYVGREPKSKIIGNIYENPELLEVSE